MRFYEIYQGEELQATLIVHDDGRKEWDWIRHEGQGSGDLKTVIEQAADADPQAGAGRIRRSPFVRTSRARAPCDGVERDGWRGRVCSLHWQDESSKSM